MIALGRAITDSAITVYFPDLLVIPEWQNKGIGKMIMKELMKKYENFHNQVLIAEDEKAREFYKRIGFKEEQFALSIMKPFKYE